MRRTTLLGALPVLLLLLAGSCSSGDNEAVDSVVRVPEPPAVSAAETATAGVTPPIASTPVTTTSTGPPYAFEGAFVSADGWQYTIQVAVKGPDPGPSVEGCIETAPPGSTNLVFEMVVTNDLTDRPSPRPDMAFSANLTEDGSAVDPAAADFESSQFNNIEVSPQAKLGPCVLTSVVGSDNGTALIPANESQLYVINLGGLPDPVPDGIVLHSRFDQGGNRAEFAVPAPASTTSPREVSATPSSVYADYDAEQIWEGLIQPTKDRVCDDFRRAGSVEAFAAELAEDAGPVERADRTYEEALMLGAVVADACT